MAVAVSKEAAGLSFHSLADIFPLMSEAEFSGLKADMAEHGQLEVIVTLDGQILDGRNRYNACRELGIEPALVEWNGVGSPQAFVISHNLHRRHLNESQRAMIAARIATRTQAEAARHATAVRVARRAGHNVGEIPQTFIPTHDQAASMMNVDPATVSDAKTVLRDGTRDEVDAVARGEAAVSSIAKNIRANLPPEERAQRRRDPNADRMSTRHMQAQIWGAFRDSLKNLSGLPSAADTIKIVRSHDKAKMTNAKLGIALNWLQEFANEWNRS